jgi:membrane protease YdiL (CAAX protease family)
VIGTSPFPVGLTPLRANLQALGLLAVFYGYLYGNAALAGGTDAKLSNPVASVFITGGLMLLLVTLLVQRDADWRASLGLERTSPLQALLFGALGVVAAYGANIVLVITYSLVSGGMVAQATQKAQWASKLGAMPLYWVLPLSMFVGVWEETVFRGFLLGRLRVAFHAVDSNPRAKLATAMAVVVSGILFGAGHGYQGPLGLVQTGAVGIAFGALTVWRKSLWPAVIAHLTMDTVGLVALKVLKPALEELAKKGGLPH